MTHLSEDLLLSIRDGVAPDTVATAHLASCSDCAGTLDALRAQAVQLAEVLSRLDAPGDLESARRVIRERVTAEAALRAGVPALSSRRARSGGDGASRLAARGLSRAAGILLVTAAGAAAALPGSPVREWLGRTLSGSSPATDSAPAAVAAPTAAPPVEANGIRLSVPSGALRVVLDAVAPGTEVRVRIVPGTEAAVYAPAGSRYTSANGRLEARVAPGPVRVELPRGVDPVSLQVAGRTYVRSGAAGLDVVGPVSARTDDEIVFRVPND